MKRLTTDQLISELLQEIRSDRMAATRRDERVNAELGGIRVALSELGKDFRLFREHVLKHESEKGEELRAVEDFVGMTDPRDRNGR